MGAALGDAVRDRVDECELPCQALDGLTADHATVLEALGRPSPGDARCWSAPAAHESADACEDVSPLLRA